MTVALGVALGPKDFRAPKPPVEVEEGVGNPIEGLARAAFGVVWFPPYLEDPV